MVGTMLNDVIDSKINNDRVSDSTALGNSATLVPSQNAVKTYVDTILVGYLNDRGNYDPTITSGYPTTGGSGSGGIIEQGDLFFISADGSIISGDAVPITTPVFTGYTVRALVSTPGQLYANWAISNVGIGYIPENSANKSTDNTMGGGTPSNVLFSTQKAVKEYVDNEIATAVPYTAENVANKIQDLTLNPTSSVEYPSSAAVTSYLSTYAPNLSSVLAAGHNLANGRNFQGTGAGTGNLGFNVNGFGTNSATSNSGTNVNAFGLDSADSNTGSNINAFGNTAAQNNAGNHVNAIGVAAANANTGSFVNAIGQSAGNGNIYSNVTLLGYGASASANDQLAFTNGNGWSARVSNTNLTASRLYELPNTSGTIALTSDIVASYKSYVVNLDWDGATWSTTAIYQNTLGGSVTLSTGIGGRLGLTTTGLFTLGKTVVMPCMIAYSQPHLFGTLDVTLQTPTVNTIYIRWNNTSGAATTPTSFGVGSYILEVRVYP
jgi:hypothetical protein